MREPSSEALLLLACLYEAHDKPEKALTLLLALREILPGERRVLRPLCHALLRTEQYAEALETADSLLALENNAPSGPYAREDMACVLRLRAQALWGLNRHEEARPLLEHSIDLMKE